MIVLSLSLLLAFSGNEPIPTTTVVPGKVNRLKEVIKVYPTPDNEGSITIQSANETTVSFYLFDLEGKLIYQTKMEKNQKQKVDGLTKGTYLYNAFQNDQNLEGGKIVLK